MGSQKKTYQIIIVFILITLGLTVFLIYPTLKDIQNGSMEIVSDKNKVLLIDAENRELGSFKKKYKDYEPNLKKTDQLFIDSQNPIGFIEFLEKIASSSGVTIDINITPLEKSEKTDNVSTTDFQIYSRGDFLQVLKFSEKLETGPYLIKIDNVTIKKSVKDLSKEKNTSHEVDADFLIKVINK